jgi:hypothetical protein
VLGASNEQQHFAPRRPSPLFLARSSFPSKKSFARAIGIDIVVGIFFENIKKTEGGIVPWVAPEHGASVHWCRGTRCLVFKAVAHS